MKKIILSLVFAASSMSVGCGAPVEDGSEEDVGMQQEALTYSGYCEVDTGYGGNKQNGMCLTIAPPGTCAVTRAASAACVVGVVGTGLQHTSTLCTARTAYRVWDTNPCTF